MQDVIENSAVIYMCVCADGHAVYVFCWIIDLTVSE